MAEGNEAMSLGLARRRGMEAVVPVYQLWGAEGLYPAQS